MNIIKNNILHLFSKCCEKNAIVSSTGAQKNSDNLLFPCGMSRSGTTLLATVLDTHSEISLAYELIPPPSLDIAKILEFVKQCESKGQESTVAIGKQLKAEGQKAEGLFLIHCHRAGLSASQTRMVLNDLCENGLNTVETLTDRLLIAEKLAKVKHRQQGSRLYGFKLNNPSVADAYKMFPRSYFIYIVRDPRDVVASHRKRGFDRSTEQICKAWNNYLEKFESFYDKNSEVALIVRYEDLVTDPDKAISRIFQVLPVEIEENVFRFYESNASVHGSHHPNAQELQQNFFTSSIGRWRSELKEGEWKKIQKLCRAGMKRQGYKLED